jgi:molybdenum cofactor synthesis domain-containing protein
MAGGEQAPALRAGVVIIGSEVLTAKVADENGPYLLGRLRALGVSVVRLLTVADEVDEIVWAVRALRSRVDWIFTTGGVGPTHDDLTVAAVARALGRRVVRSSELIGLLQKYGGAALPPEALRMSNVVAGTELVSVGETRLPAMVVDRVALLPGVPALARRQFEALAPRLVSSVVGLREIYVDAYEATIAAVLDRVAAEHPAVDIGSYPHFEASDYKVKLTLESRDRAALGVAVDALLTALPKGSVVREG